MEQIRLQKYLADSGIASRRKSEEYILNGLVSVNGKTVTELGTKVDIDKDTVTYQGKIVKPDNKFVYILLNKPAGYITTTEEQYGRPMVLDLLRKGDTLSSTKNGVTERNVPIHKRLVPVGRLDMYTTGALLLTNDGEFVNKITHPKHEINKTYEVVTKGIPRNEDLELLRKGVRISAEMPTKNSQNLLLKTGKEQISVIEEYITKKAKVTVITIDKKKNTAFIEITIQEGKNRQVRKMFDTIDTPVISIHRSKIGNLSVKDLKLGEYRILNKKEVDEVLNGR